MVKFWLVGLNLLEVPVIEITRVSKVSIPKHDHTATPIADCKVLSLLIEGYCRQNVRFVHVRSVPFAQAVYIDPISWFTLICLLLDRLRGLFIF